MAMKTWAGMAGAGLLLVGGGAQAALVDVGNGLINDTVLNITWVADAGLSNSQLGGTAQWQPLVNWAAGLVYGGYDDWRLASMSVLAGTPTGSTDSVVTSADCATDEVAHPNTSPTKFRYQAWAWAASRRRSSVEASSGVVPPPMGWIWLPSSLSRYWVTMEMP
jgi:hypothetical protein